MTARKILSLGLVADLQYANIDDGFNWNGTKKRYYRTGLNLLKTAMKDWKERDIEFVLQLGDVIDGFCKRAEEPIFALNRILDVFNNERWPVLHVVGNHELYNFKKDCLYSSPLFKNLPPNNKAFYASELYPGLKVCVLNTYEISALGEVEGTDDFKKAHAIIDKKNPNQDKNDPTGLESVNKRFVRFNGGTSDQQNEWLRKELASAVEKSQNVFVLGHNPVFLPATDPMCLCWNYSDILDVLSQYSDCVVCYISGHDHDGGYAVDDNGIHHITMKGVIENPESYAVGTVFVDSLVIEGRGEICDVTCPLRFKLS